MDILYQRDIFTRPRVANLILKRVYEREYRGQSIGVRQRQKTYLYELCFAMELKGDVQEFNIEEKSDKGDVVFATMFNRSTLQVIGSEILGLTPGSLEITTCGAMPNERKERFPDGVEVSVDILTNSMDLRYLIVDPENDLELKVKFMVANKLDVNLLKVQNIDVNSKECTFHRNGIATEKGVCTWLQKGFNWRSICNQTKNPEYENFKATQNEDDGPVISSEHRSRCLTTPSRKRTANGVSKYTTGINWNPFQFLKKEDQSGQGEKIAIVLEFIDHQRILMIVKANHKLDLIKRVIMNTLKKWKFYPADTDVVAARCYPFNERDLRIIRDLVTVDDKRTLGEQWGNIRMARCVVLTRSPELPAPVSLRMGRTSEIQQEILFRFKSCHVLLRNVEACNRAAEIFMKPEQRMRFNEPTIKPTGFIYSEDLGDLMITVSREVKRLSLNLLRLSNMMLKNENLTYGTTEYENYKRTIQNVMDATRYAGPLFRAISRFIIPLREPSPRRIGILG